MTFFAVCWEKKDHIYFWLPALDNPFEMEENPMNHLLVLESAITLLAFWVGILCAILHWQIQYSHEPGSKLVALGMAIPPLIGNPYNGYINPYYWVDFSHPLLYGNNGSWSTRSHTWKEDGIFQDFRTQLDKREGLMPRLLDTLFGRQISAPQVCFW